MTAPSITTVEAKAHIERFMPVDGIRRLARGAESIVFAVTSRGTSHAARFGRHEAPYLRERAVRHLLQGSLPTPQPDVILPLDGSLVLCLSPLIQGSPLAALAPHARSTLMPALCNAVALMARCDPSAEADMLRPEEGRTWQSWVAGLTREEERRLHSRDAGLRVLSGHLQPGWIDRLERALDAGASACPDPGRLVHGDISPGNLLASGGELTGILDWSTALAGDPLYDVARVVLWAPWQLQPRIDMARALLEERWSESFDDLRLATLALRSAARDLGGDGGEDAGLLLAWCAQRADQIAGAILRAQAGDPMTMRRLFDAYIPSDPASPLPSPATAAKDGRPLRVPGPVRWPLTPRGEL